MIELIFKPVPRDPPYTKEELDRIRRRNQDERDRAREEERQRQWEIHDALEILKRYH